MISLEYRTPHDEIRPPGILTALAVMCFVVAILGLIPNVLTGVIVGLAWHSFSKDVVIGTSINFDDESSESASKLSPEQRRAIIDRIEFLCASSLTADQVETLQKVLRSPKQTFIAPAPDTQRAAEQVTSANMNSINRVAIRTADQQLLIGPGGQEFFASSKISPYTIVLPPGTKAALIVLSVSTALSVIFDVVVIVLAMRLLKCRLDANITLRRWALGKLVIELAYALSSVLFAAAVGAGTTYGFLFLPMLVLCLFSWAVPVTMLIALRLRKVRDFFSRLNSPSAAIA